MQCYMHPRKIDCEDLKDVPIYLRQKYIPWEQMMAIWQKLANINNLSILKYKRGVKFLEKINLNSFRE